MKTSSRPILSALAPFVFLAAALLPGPAHAGLRFTPVPGPEGADTSALAPDGTILWAGTLHGVWRLESGTWSFDGLGEKTVLSIAVSGGAVWAATGDGLWRRSADGTWSPEPLPGDPPIVNAVVADGSTLWAAGLGVFRRSGSWTALPGAGGVVPSLAVFQGDLVAGVAGRGAVRYPGGTGAPVPMSAGIGVAEAAQAFTTSGGILYAGTPRGVYGWNGASWARENGYGLHDVRALAGAAGSLWAASLDAGVSRKSGATWSTANDGLLFASAKSFALLGSDLYVGTAGAPVYRFSGGTWSPAGTGLAAAVVSDMAHGTSRVHMVPLTAAAGRGAGLSIVSPAPGSSLALPAGCGDVRAASGAGSDQFLVATNCGPYLVAASGAPPPFPADQGLPAGVVLSALTLSAGSEIVAGTTNAGIWAYSSGGWSPLNDGLAATASIATVRQVGTDLFAGPDRGVVRLGTDGAWHDESSGLPAASVVAALGGPSAPSGPLYAGLLSGGLYRRDADSTFWRSDTAGVGSGPVTSIDAVGSRLFAAAGSAAIFRKQAGTWRPESSGLPAGAEVRLARRGWWNGVDLVYAGTAGNGLFVADAVSSVTTLPVVLDVPQTAGPGFRTELTLGNRSAEPVGVTLMFSAAPGFGAPAGGSAIVTLPAGTEVRAADALAYLRGLGISVPPAGPTAPVAGSLSMSAGIASDGLYGQARSFTPGSAGGTFGVFLPTTNDLDAAEEEAYVYGLRSLPGVSRSNLAIAALPGRGADPISLEVQVYGATGSPAPTLLTKTLAPGDWYQWNGVLEKAGLPAGSFGWARIRRVSGTGAWTAYGVVNDAVTSDGSVLPLYRPGGLSAARKLIVPIVVDTFGDAGARFTTELTLVNDGSVPTPVDLVYRPAPGFGSAPGVSVVTVPLAARQQTTLPDLIQYLRDHGVAIPDPATGGPQAGTLSVVFRSLQNIEGPRTAALARTSTPGGSGGTYGVFYAAAAEGGGSRTSALVPGLVQNASARSNLAVVHTGGGSGGPVTVSVRLYDAATGSPVGAPLTKTLYEGDWYQWTRVLEKASVFPGTTAAYAVVTRTSGDDTFLAYGVVNDAVTSDGSWIAMIPSEEY